MPRKTVTPRLNTKPLTKGQKAAATRKANREKAEAVAWEATRKANAEAAEADEHARLLLEAFFGKNHIPISVPDNGPLSKTLETIRAAQTGKLPEYTVKAEKSSRTFWVLWEPTSSLPPRQKFSTPERAFQAATAMAERHGKTFFVLEAIGYAGDIPTPRVTVERF